MKRKLTFLPQVANDVAQAFEYYVKVSPRLSERFRQSLSQRFEQIVVRPESFPRVDGDVRFARTAKFPYLVFFQVRDNLILIIAVLHGASEPDRWRSRAVTD